jgi:ABC-type multidrug transport system permease subunit
LTYFKFSCLLAVVLKKGVAMYKTSKFRVFAGVIVAVSILSAYTHFAPILITGEIGRVFGLIAVIAVCVYIVKLGVVSSDKHANRKNTI